MPDSHASHPQLNEAAALHNADKIDEAADIYEAVLKEDPDCPDALHLAGLVAFQRGHPSTALELVSRSLAIRPNCGPVHGTLGLAMGATGRHVSAMAEFRRAVMLDPSLKESWANLIFATDLDPGTSKEAARAVRREYDALHVAPLVQTLPWYRRKRPSPYIDPDQKLTIGYISNDFRLHSAGMLAWPVISRHDFEKFNIVLFDGARPHHRDEVNKRFRQLPVSLGFGIFGKSDEDVADTVRVAGVDVLVDCTGFAGGSRIGVFARRPAPVQIEGWAYLADTTALSCFDGIFADHVTVPAGSEDGFTERVIRLPSFIPYEPLVAMPYVSPPPVLKNGYVTFGYMGRAHKLNDEVLAAWAQILHRVPTARLLIKSPQLDDENYAFTVQDALVGRGILDHRIEIRGGTGVAEHAAAYADVDIALDTWPQNGGVTTLEAAYMGVPTVTLIGDRMAGRMGYSIISEIDPPLLLASTVSNYIAAAVQIANDNVGYFEAMRNPRIGLRQDLQTSPFMLHEAYARAVEDAYREMWQRWCSEVPS